MRSPLSSLSASRNCVSVITKNHFLYVDFSDPVQYFGDNISASVITIKVSIVANNGYYATIKATAPLILSN